MAATTKGTTSASIASVARDPGTQDVARPTSVPPAIEARSSSGVAVADAVPLILSDEELTRMLGSNTALAAPSLEPPVTKEAAGLTATATVWKTAKVTSLWSINQNRNSWAGFDGGVGWQKFANNSDSAIMAFTLLASHARDAQGQTSIRQETTDNMVHEIYVW